MSAEVERYSAQVDAASELPWWELIEHVAKVVDVVVRTPFVSSAYRGNTAAATAAVMYGHELGIGPMAALNKLDVIDGRVSPSAELARALAARVGEVWVEDETDQSCTVCAQRYGSTVVHRVTWTMADARRAGLANRGAWRSYPREMLFARASAAVVRRAFPDVLGGITTFAEERDDEAVAELTPERPQPSRRTSRKAPHRHTMAEVAEAPQAPEPADEAPTSPEPASDAHSAAETPLSFDLPLTLPEPAPAPAPEPAEAPIEVGEAIGEPVEQRPPRLTRRAGAPGGAKPPSSSAMAAMHAMFNSIGVERDQRQSRLDITASIVGHEVTTSSDLSAEEVSAVLDALAAIERDPRLLVADEQGAYRYARAARS